MSLSLDFHTTDDPEGHGESLLLKGDWLFVKISDGVCTGLGEATHNGDDRRCRKVIAELFSRHVQSMWPSLESIHHIERGVLAEAPDYETLRRALLGREPDERGDRGGEPAVPPAKGERQP